MMKNIFNFLKKKKKIDTKQTDGPVFEFFCDGIPWIPVRPDGKKPNIKINHYPGCGCINQIPLDQNQ